MQSQNLEAGTEAETMEECLLPGLLSLLSCTTRDHLPKEGTTHNGGPPILIINQENA